MAAINSKQFADENMSYNTPDGKPVDHRQLLIDLIALQHGPQAAMVANSAFKTQDTQIKEAMVDHGKTANEILQSQGVDLNALANPQKGFFGRWQDNFNKQVGNVTNTDVMNNLVKASQIKKDNTVMNPEASIQRMADLNGIIDQKLPGYQVTQGADGNFIVHPKPAGVLAQISPEEMDGLSNSLVNGQVVPSQLPRTQKNQVIAAAIAKDPNYNPAQADMDFAANKQGAGAFIKNYNNLESFHKDFEKNSDYLLKLSANFDRSKMPLLNRAIVAGKKEINGDPKATQILQAVNTVANGYARLQNPTLGGQALSDAARKEAHDLINGFNTDEQIQALLSKENGSMRIDAQNRIDAALETKHRLDTTYKKGSSDSGFTKHSSGLEYRIINN